MKKSINPVAQALKSFKHTQPVTLESQNDVIAQSNCISKNPLRKGLASFLKNRRGN